MKELPQYLEIAGAELKEMEFLDYPPKRFHTIDYNGYTLILKMEGSFYSYRDWVASRLFQHININTQSSILLKLDKETLLKYGLNNKEVYQQGIVMVEQHEYGPCGPTCDYERLKVAWGNEDWKEMGNTSFHDTEVIIMKSLLANFFLANEPSDVMIGKNHHLYLIDNSQMFSLHPSRESILEWLLYPSLVDNQDRQRIFIETAKRIASLDSVWSDLCNIPAGYKVEELWDIRERIAETIKLSNEIVTEFNGLTYLK